MPTPPRTPQQHVAILDLVDGQFGGNVMMAARATGSSRNTLQHRYHSAQTWQSQQPSPKHAHRQHIEVQNGVVLIGSDAHYWPHRISTAHKAFVKFCADLQPKAIILNGDMLDGATISRHPPIGWEDRPTLVDEIEACKARLGEIEKAAPNAKRYWNLGNHDARFETRLATVAPEYARIHGVHLKDHFPYWRGAWSTWINGDVVVKHRYRGGIHATRNNTLNAGKSIVTSHLHSLKVSPLTDYSGTRWGVDTGTLSDGPQDPQFVDYLEDAPADWRPGFVILTFHKGRLLWPELVAKFDDHSVEFRGQVIKVCDDKAPRK